MDDGEFKLHVQMWVQMCQMQATWPVSHASSEVQPLECSLEQLIRQSPSMPVELLQMGGTQAAIFGNFFVVCKFHKGRLLCVTLSGRKRLFLPNVAASAAGGAFSVCLASAIIYWARQTLAGPGRSCNVCQSASLVSWRIICLYVCNARSCFGFMR